jgi:inositol hexakisphosphate/diphosphoinositol-pentakisphosphate kinase
MICLPILDKILEDMMFWKTKNMEEEFWKYKTKGEDNWRHIRTRLYFTSASHLYSLLNLLVLGNDRFFLGKTSEEDRQKIRNILYMGYLSHV